jgi:hypothetical protein
MAESLTMINWAIRSSSERVLKTLSAQREVVCTNASFASSKKIKNDSDFLNIIQGCFVNFAFLAFAGPFTLK